MVAQTGIAEGQNSSGPIKREREYQRSKCVVSGCDERDITARHYNTEHELLADKYLQTGSEQGFRICVLCPRGRNISKVMQGPHKGMEHIISYHLNIILKDLSESKTIHASDVVGDTSEELPEGASEVSVHCSCCITNIPEQGRDVRAFMHSLKSVAHYLEEVERERDTLRGETDKLRQSYEKEIKGVRDENASLLVENSRLKNIADPLDTDLPEPIRRILSEENHR